MIMIDKHIFFFFYRRIRYHIHLRKKKNATLMMMMKNSLDISDIEIVFSILSNYYLSICLVWFIIIVFVFEIDIEKMIRRVKII